MGIWKNVSSQVGGLAKHVIGRMVQEPVEVIKNAVGDSADTGASENQGMQAMEAGQRAQPPSDDPNQPKGFKTAEDFQKYQQLSGNKDEMELAMLRRRLFQQNGLNTDLESGMQQARMEYEEKEQQRNQIEEKEKEEEKWVIEQKKQEDMSVKAAKEVSSAENKAWGAG